MSARNVCSEAGIAQVPVYMEKKKKAKFELQIQRQYEFAHSHRRSSRRSVASGSLFARELDVG